jgi:FtsH-binding integral membrane protein
MNSGFNSGNQGPYAESTWVSGPVAQAPAEVRMNFIRKTYLLFMAGILTAVVGGVLCLNVEPVLRFALAILNQAIIALVVIVGGSFAAQAVARFPV